MSHNLYTINNAGGNVVSYHGFSRGVIYIGHGEDVAYAAISYAVGDYQEFYDSNPINTIDGASFTKRAGTNWIQKISLPAGTYWIQAYSLTPIVSATQIQHRLNFYYNDGTETAIPAGDFLVRNSIAINEGRVETAQTASALFTLSATSDIYWKIHLTQGTKSSAGNRQSKSNFIIVRRLA